MIRVDTWNLSRMFNPLVYTHYETQLKGLPPLTSPILVCPSHPSYSLVCESGYHKRPNPLLFDDDAFGFVQKERSSSSGPLVIPNYPGRTLTKRWRKFLSRASYLVRERTVPLTFPRSGTHSPMHAIPILFFRSICCKPLLRNEPGDPSRS